MNIAYTLKNFILYVRACVCAHIVAAMKCVHSVRIIIKRGIKNAILYVYSFNTFMHVCEVCYLLVMLLFSSHSADSADIIFLFVAAAAVVVVVNNGCTVRFVLLRDRFK